ncbi:hypothetical protein IEN91_05080 [Bacillus velezensis]|uniref:hypothetical protein n=1 Tax=Bacillus velezensis TaxID=492670 RepID=UPI0018C6C894|nr:hypothetical protein [Bacillus velezensis]QPK89813.1 hypothetical protein IEN91_05080 [Bacillus velezensis]
MSNWKKKLGKEDDYIISEQVDNYLKQHDFYEHTLSPRFFNDESFVDQIVNHDAPCLRLDIDDPRDSDNTMRIFITSSEVYMEVQNGWRSLDRSYHKKLDKVDMENIDEILDEVSDW